MTIRVLLIEDHASLRQAMSAVMDLEDDIEVIGHREDGDPAAAVRAAAGADVAVVDLELPVGHGADVVAALLEADPPVPSVVLTGLRDDRELGRAIQAGARSVLQKTAEIPEIIAAVRVVASGGVVLPAAETQRRLRALDADLNRRRRADLVREALTSREVEVLEHLVYGASTAETAERLGISPETVQTHVRNLMGKLGAGSRLEAVSLALQYEVVDPP
ncbi:putative two-component system response regulator [Euzebya pacifica]|uniref:Putative two-component system response regulator n=1 Tax=Euzebya pacifica TaxID=1608957 RepID=A0A346XXW6_9ACTN|nr:response regulator transcription factor [Euzebya pacifica]AXV07063.1 putative two-component system response regulator [Euzebya pacifica]